jgi:hypothetical protein
MGGKPLVLWTGSPVRLRIASTVFLALAARLSLRPPGEHVVCPLRLATGIPCPFCGTTTSVLATMRGQPGEALAANPFGLLLIAAAGFAALRPPRILRLPHPAVVTGTIAGLWLLELRRFGPMSAGEHAVHHPGIHYRKRRIS